MYIDICNFPTSSELSSHYAALLFRHDKTFNGASDVQSREGRDHQHQWDTNHWGSGEYTGHCYYKGWEWSLQVVSAGETSKSGSLFCVMASAYL